jgi:hypothetical protein
MDTESILNLYDVSDEKNPDIILVGYDKDHARRTASIVCLIAPKIGIGTRWQSALLLTALLHDIGRAGLDPELFSVIFQTAHDAGIPVRLADMKKHFPELKDNEIVDKFLELSTPFLLKKDIKITKRVIEHVRMRMDYKGRVSSVIKANARKISELGIVIEPWMEKVILYYYYPDLMINEPEIIQRMGMLLVACENFEALNNFRRGRDYYGRTEEKMIDVFLKLDEFVQKGLIHKYIIKTLAKVTLDGDLHNILREARGVDLSIPISNEEVEYLKALTLAT